MTRGTISVKAVAAGMSDKQSFGNTLALKAQRMIESHTRAAEMQLLYGGLGLGNATSKANTSATTTTPVSYTHLTLPTTLHECRSRWSPYH